ncbi:MAG: L-glutamate gamma-semialdehyde dehydrogenase, partial [Pseudomonadota bacterium]
FSGARLSAIGRDETDPATAAQLERAAQASLSAEEPGGAALDVTDPAFGVRIGRAPLTDPSAIAAMSERAAGAAASWRARTDRAEILLRAADLYEARQDAFTALCVREAGKTLPDAVAEVREAVDFLRYYAVESRKLDGDPLGVVACVSPWNFPLAIFTGQVAAALAAGAAVVAKPAEQTPLIAALAVDLLHEAGVPDDALQLAVGDGPSVGAPLVADPNVAGVVFTGSTATAQAINRALAAAGKSGAPLIAETGGINAMIVDSTALLEQAVGDAVASAFQSAGQRCSACRIVCVQDDVAPRFMDMLAGAMAELAVGDPALLSTDVGPVVDADAKAAIDAHIARLDREARLIARAPAPSLSSGTFVTPCAYEVASPAAVREEIFGPVLHVARFAADALDAVLEELDALGFGLTLGVHTRIDETMERIVERARVGNIYVNRNQIGAVVGVQPFGGERLSGTGPKAGGPHYLPALQLRHPEPSTGTLRVATAAVTESPSLDATLAELDAAARRWGRTPDRGAVLRRAAEACGARAAPVFERAAELFDAHFRDASILPGPTGETNRLRMRGRGVVACLGPDARAFDQAALALGAGDAVLCDLDVAGALAAPLARDGWPLVAGVDLSDGVPIALLHDDRLSGVAFDADGPAGRNALAEALANRTGPIAPILTSADAPGRYGVERTLTVNTTAAGGDVRLLSLAD